MKKMSNETEREAFEQTLNPNSRTRNEVGDYVSAAARDSWSGFQAGAAYQREQVKGLVEALESIAEYWNRDANEQAMQGACWNAIETAEEALATYRAAQEGKK